MPGFIKDALLLREDHTCENVFEISEIKTGLERKLSTTPTGSVFAIVGPFGSGKSTLLNEIKKTSDQDEVKWLEFDAWKYPERKDMWEGFVLDVSEQIGSGRNRTRDRIDGNDSAGWKLLLETASYILPNGLVGVFKNLFNTSPIRRVFELQELLQSVIRNFDKNIVIILEDVDRSGDQGVYFLETVSQFLKNHHFEKKVIAIAPIADVSYLKNSTSYAKCVDYFEFLPSQNLEFTRFVEMVFDPSLFEGTFRYDPRGSMSNANIKKRQTVSFLQSLLGNHPEINMRLIKLILRKADLVYNHQCESGLNPDFRITLCLEAARHIRIDSQNSYFDVFLKGGAITSINNNIFSAFLYIIFTNEDDLYGYGSSGNLELKQTGLDFKLVKRTLPRGEEGYPSYPYLPEYHGNQERYISLCDFYFLT